MNALHPDAQDSARTRLLAWHAAGEIEVQIDPETFVGLEAIAAAADHVFARRNVGKTVVRVG